MYTENSTLGELLEDPKTAYVLEKHLPGISSNAMASMGKSMTLKQISGFPQANLSDEILAVIAAELARIPKQKTSNVRSEAAGENPGRERSMNESVAVVTGAGGGIGRSTAVALSMAGYKVVAVDFNAQTGEETAALIREYGGESLFVQADVSQEEDVERYTQAAVDTYGRIDVFFNNAGILQKFSLIEDLETAEFDRIMNVNVRGMFLGLKKVLKIMHAQGSGSIINTASTAGLRAEHSMSAYTASKHAVIGLTKAASIEYVRKGVRVNAICPGGVDTALTQAVPLMMQQSGYIPEEFPNMRIGRFAQPSDIAEMVVFLASDRSAYMTGAVITIDGGLTL